MIYDNEDNIPKYVNCKLGFLKLAFTEGNKIIFMGFTANLRTATPIFGNVNRVNIIAKHAFAQLANRPEYFVIIQPTFMGFNKREGDAYEYGIK